MLTAILKEAWISIASYKLRTFLTMLGIMIGVAAVVMMVSAGQASSKPHHRNFCIYGQQPDFNRAGRTRNRRRPRGQGVAQRNGG